ncbi:transcriptional regulator LytR [Halobacillus andaensis]|uniref:Transcriptional regulator LytR n=1 Tax=Halobacillus andaensis TaxID=1176239 RepID=A0A917EXE1_HALAA|nr:LCP family protein [Halobacillus andaensis]MBP2005348.1 LCP family protein required for cell wall assembly [Halobacillus andaensis]GGF30781.1 transcriptional regulator LytR [Halobacillus andaensis]
MGRKDKRKSKHSKGRWWKILLLIFGVVLITAAGLSLYLLNDVRSTVNNDLHENIESIDTAVTKKKVKNEEPVNILLLGVDERENDRGRSDTMIVLTLDPVNEKMQMVSIPRDTEAEIIGDGRVTRMNHAYAYGGSNMVVDTVENFLDIEVDYFTRVNMKGLSQLVDAVNGITVQNTRSFQYDGYQFPEGQLELSGEEALAYVRMRKEDPQGDMGRNERQRQVIQGVINKGASLDMVNQMGNVMEVLGENVSTNMDFQDMRQLATKYNGARKEAETYQMSGSSKTSSGMYLIEMSEEEIQKTHNMIENFGL